MTQIITKYRISDLVSALEGKMHDQSLNKLSGDVLEKVDEAVRNCLLKFDFKETKRYADLELVTGETRKFVCPTDMKGNSVVTLQSSTDDTNYYTRKTNLTGAETVQYYTPDQYAISIDYDSGEKTILFYDGSIDTNTTYILGYYSISLFRNEDDEAGVLKDKPTSYEDIILLEKDSINVLLYELAELVAQEMQGEDSSYDLKYWAKKKEEVHRLYGQRYPSEAKPRQQKYYRLFKR